MCVRAELRPPAELGVHTTCLGCVPLWKSPLTRYVAPAGSPGCAAASWTCFFRESLCSEEPNRPEGVAPSALLDSTTPSGFITSSSVPSGFGFADFNFETEAELEWPQSLRRAMATSLVLESRLHRGLQPGLQRQVQTLLSRRAVQPRNVSRASPQDAGHTGALRRDPGAIGMHIRRGDACETLKVSRQLARPRPETRQSPPASPLPPPASRLTNLSPPTRLHAYPPVSTHLEGYRARGAH